MKIEGKRISAVWVIWVWEQRISCVKYCYSSPAAIQKTDAENGGPTKTIIRKGKLIEKWSVGECCLGVSDEGRAWEGALGTGFRIVHYQPCFY